jgi:arylsulfatase A-like enzyme
MRRRSIWRGSTGIADEQRRTYACDDVGNGRWHRTNTRRPARRGPGENTLVFFFSDNGGPTMPGTTINGSSNAPLRGSKRQTWEGGIRVPFIIRWKGRIAEGKIDARPVIQLDVCRPPSWRLGSNRRPSGSSMASTLLPYLTGKLQGDPHEALYWRLFAHMAIRKGPGSS